LNYKISCFLHSYFKITASRCHHCKRLLCRSCDARANPSFTSGKCLKLTLHAFTQAPKNFATGTSSIVCYARLWMAYASAWCVAGKPPGNRVSGQWFTVWPIVCRGSPHTQDGSKAWRHLVSHARILTEI